MVVMVGVVIIVVMLVVVQSDGGVEKLGMVLVLELVAVDRSSSSGRPQNFRKLAKTYFS